MCGKPQARKGVLILVLSLSLGAAGQAAGQITFDGCRDFGGRPVASVRAAVNDVATATMSPSGAPVIYYNPLVLSQMAPATRLFFYAHECGHHALGHTLGASHPLSREQEADCWAIRTLMDEGRLDEEDLRTIQGDLARLGREDWTHLPGRQRAINLRTCLADTGSTRAEANDECEYANDGECDEPDLCRPGTDGGDCGGRRRRPERSSEPALGTSCVTRAGLCPLVQALQMGGACYCTSLYGPIAGVVGP